MRRIDEIDREIKKILGEAEPDNPSQPGPQTVYITINKAPKKSHVKLAGAAAAVLIISLTVTIQSDSLKKNLNLFTNDLVTPNVKVLPDPKSDISIVPAANNLNKSYCIIVGPGCSRRQYLIQKHYVPNLNKSEAEKPI
jgi:hypothetical protein